MLAVDDLIEQISIDELEADPYPLYARMRAERPVAYVPCIGRWLVAPNMSQGLVMAGGRVQVIFESCSSAYDGTVDGNAADYIVCSVHHGPFLSLP